MNMKTLGESYGARGFAGAIYGQSGVGKTSLLNSFPPDQTLLVDIEGGMSVLRKHMRKTNIVELPKPTSQANAQEFRLAINELYAYLISQKHTIRYVWMDSASELETYFQMAQALANGQPFIRMKEYGEASQLAENIIIQFRDLRIPAVNKVGWGISSFFVCGEVPIEITRTEDRVITNMFPMLTKKFAQRVSHRLDFVARLEMNATGQQFLRLNKTQEIMAKTRFRSLKNITAERTYIDNFFDVVVRTVEKDIVEMNTEPEAENPSQRPPAQQAQHKPQTPPAAPSGGTTGQQPQKPKF